MGTRFGAAAGLVNDVAFDKAFFDEPCDEKKLIIWTLIKGRVPINKMEI